MSSPIHLPSCPSFNYLLDSDESWPPRNPYSTSSPSEETPGGQQLSPTRARSATPPPQPNRVSPELRETTSGGGPFAELPPPSLFPLRRGPSPEQRKEFVSALTDTLQKLTLTMRPVRDQESGANELFNLLKRPTTVSSLSLSPTILNRYVSISFNQLLGPGTTLPREQLKALKVQKEFQFLLCQELSRTIGMVIQQDYAGSISMPETIFQEVFQKLQDQLLERPLMPLFNLVCDYLKTFEWVKGRDYFVQKNKAKLAADIIAEVFLRIGSLRPYAILQCPKGEEPSEELIFKQAELVKQQIQNFVDQELSYALSSKEKYIVSRRISANLLLQTFPRTFSKSFETVLPRLKIAAISLLQSHSLLRDAQSNLANRRELCLAFSEAVALFMLNAGSTLSQAESSKAFESFSQYIAEIYEAQALTLINDWVDRDLWAISQKSPEEIANHDIMLDTLSEFINDGANQWLLKLNLFIALPLLVSQQNDPTATSMLNYALKDKVSEEIKTRVIKFRSDHRKK